MDQSRNFILAGAVIVGLLLVGGAIMFTSPSLANHDPSHLPGTLESTGTHFQIIDSSYLNITLDSTESIKVSLESVPRMILMRIEADSSVTPAPISTTLTISGLSLNTSYYLYQDNYHNETQFLTNESGFFSFEQDLSSPHLVFIQPTKSTKFIKDDATGGDCSQIGIWNQSTKTCALTQDLFETIQIDSDNITLDGNNHTITGANTGSGVYLSGRTGTTIKNLTINNFYTGIFLTASNNNTLTNNSLSNNNLGVYLYYLNNNNNLTGNTLLNNSYGIYLYYSFYNSLNNNAANSNSNGNIILSSSNNNALTGNVANNSNWNFGIAVWATSNNNTITNNTALNNGIGMFLGGENNIVTHNTVQENSNTDLRVSAFLDSDCNNTIQNNIGSGSRPIGYFNSLVNLQNQTFSELILCNADYSNVNNITIEGSSVLKNNGLFLAKTDHSTITNVNSSDNYHGINLEYSNANNIADNTLNSNTWAGILNASSNNNNFTGNTLNSNYGVGGYGFDFVLNSNNNTVSNNVLSGNPYGIRILGSNNNQIYRNNFLNNLTQTYISSDGINNLFNLPLPDGGNYWLNYDTPQEGCSDSNNDKVCDSPYVFTNGQDNYPWTIQNGWQTPTNQAPTFSNLQQYKSDSTTQIQENGITQESTVIFSATLSDSDNDTVKLQIELKEKEQQFDGTNLIESSLINSGSEATIARYGLVAGSYHWRARAIDAQGNASDWQEFGTAGNVDFEVKLVPLYTQVRSPYPSDPETDEWDGLKYGTGNYGDCIDVQSGISTIRRCGCAITSMVMLGRYYGINTGIDNTNADPETINTWLTNNSGYTKKGSLWWGKAIEYLGFIENGVKKVRLSLDYHNATSTLPIVDNYITSAKPAVAYSNKFGHYFIVDDKLQNTYTIKDPRWYNTKKLNDPENLANEIRGYNNYFDTANLFSYLETPKKLTGSIYLYLSSPAELLVTDPQGRKLGKDPIQNLTYSEIPDSSYTQEGPIITSDTPLDPNQIHKTKVIYIPTPIDGNYDVQVIGTDTGSYELNTFSYDNQGDSHTQTSTGNTQTDLNIDYNLNFTPDQPENINIQPEDTEAPIISHTQLNQEYILNSSPIIFNFSAQDSRTGVFKLSAILDGQPIVDGTVINFNQIGEHTIMIETEDFVGNKRTETITYKVIYDFSGFPAPIKADGSGIYKLGRTLPVKFQLKDANGVFVSTAAAQLFVAKISNGIIGNDEVPLSTSNADTGNIFRYDSTNNQYIYNLSTDTLSVGSWQLKVVLSDNRYYTVVISIK